MEKSNVILLMNLGSPDSTEVKDVRKYLNEFLMDKRVIDMPYLLRLLLVKGIIVPVRAPKSAEKYKTIWSEKGSPLIYHTDEQARLLKESTNWNIEICMRYGNPSTQSALDLIQKKYSKETNVILFPLYPHYAMSSYETAVEQVKEIYLKGNYSFTLEVIPPFYNEPLYIDALSKLIQPYLEKPYDHILFSYHGIPERHVTKQDPTQKHCLKIENCCDVPCKEAQAVCYRHQVFTTTELVVKKLNIPKEKYSNSFQSRLGRDKWLLPFTAHQLMEFPKRGIKKLLIVCPAFISDCLETLEEIEMEGRETFIHAGGEEFTLIPCLNEDPEWILAMQKIVESFTETKKTTT